jgi:hypothetical protein
MQHFQLQQQPLLAKPASMHKRSTISSTRTSSGYHPLSVLSFSLSLLFPAAPPFRIETKQRIFIPACMSFVERAGTMEATTTQRTRRSGCKALRLPPPSEEKRREPAERERQRESYSSPSLLRAETLCPNFASFLHCNGNGNGNGNGVADRRLLWLGGGVTTGTTRRRFAFGFCFESEFDCSDFVGWFLSLLSIRIVLLSLLFRSLSFSRLYLASSGIIYICDRTADG